MAAPATTRSTAAAGDYSCAAATATTTPGQGRPRPARRRRGQRPPAPRRLRGRRGRRLDGGPGVDAIDGDYSSRFSSDEPPVAFTLTGGADDGRPGEGDDVRDVERIELNIAGTYAGSDGPDEFRIAQIVGSVTLRGLGGADLLRGADGPDRLEGGTGDDTLDAGFGDDVIVGGPGKDAIYGDLRGGDCGPALVQAALRQRHGRRTRR